MPIIKITEDKKQLSRPCRETTPKEAAPVIRDLMDTANHHKKNCMGLAANQIGSDLRVFVVKVRGKFMAFVNPSFKPCGKVIDSLEGCLSFPRDAKRKVKRYSMIKIAHPRINGRVMILDGITAIAVQHEMNHLDGVII